MNDQEAQPAGDALAAPEEGTVPVAPLAPSAPIWQRLNWRYAMYGALAVLLVVMLGAGAHALAARQPARKPPVDSLATAVARTTPLPTATSSGLTTAPLPSASIRFDVSRTTFSQQCIGTQALPAITTTLDNTQSTIAVDWWVDIQEKTPDGKTPWATVDMPYGTTPMKYIQDINITPDSTLCTALQGKATPMVYHATVNYAGLGAVTIIDTISPPAP